MPSRQLVLNRLLCVLPAVFLARGAEAQQPLPIERPSIGGPLSLEEAVQTGLRESLLLRAAEADVRVAAAETRAARSMTRSQVSATTYLTHGDSANVVGSSPGVTPANLFVVPSRPFADQNLTLMVPLYTGGRLNSLVRAAHEREGAAMSGVAEVEAQTALRIREAYLRALLAGELAKAAKARLDADNALLDTTRAQVDAGKGIEASVRRVEAESADAQRSLTTARNDEAKSLLDLKAAMGVRLDSPVTLSETLTFNAPSGDMQSALKQAAANRPELKANLSRIAAAAAQKSSARSALEPQIYGAAMADGSVSSSRTSGGYTLGITISIPLFDGGQRRAEVERARAMHYRAEAEAREAELRVTKEVQQAWLDVETAAQNYRTGQVALQAAQSAYEVIALRVQNQKAILVEQLDALATLTQARANAGVVLYEHAIAIARLRRAIGKP